MRPDARTAGLLILSALVSAPAAAATYTVGPSGRQYTQLTALVNSVNLQAGDVVLVDGNATYAGGIVVSEDDGGAAGNPVVIRWRRDPGTSRPKLQGGTHTIKFQESDHVVFEGFEVTGGTSSCVFNAAHDVVVRDSVIHDCPAHGVLGADIGSGSFTLEYNEIYNAGQGTQRHAVYMASDEVAYPGSVFRMQYNYVHDGKGGNLLKSRHERNEIYYNWFEGAAYQEMELIGPDCEAQADNPGWTPGLKTENSDVVGNVIIHTATGWPNALRVGGDLNGRNMGHVRLVNNTILLDRGGSVNAVLVQLGQGRLEMHNNVFYQSQGASPAIVRENPASDVDVPFCAPLDREPWALGRKVTGSNNWVQTNAALVPGASEWSGTLKGANPSSWTADDITQRLLRPKAGSALLNAGNPAPPAPIGSPFPTPLLVPAQDPPSRIKLAIGGQRTRGTADGLDIGAYERAEVLPGGEPKPMEGTQPLIPPRSQPLAPPASVTAAPASSSATQTASQVLPIDARARAAAQSSLEIRRRYALALALCMAPRRVATWHDPPDALQPLRCLSRIGALR
ncbi:MAG TPA: hypothetical protein VJ806_12950 [Luteimonas sp.]|nr:hypothetical protein [Luteimonas sp.]